MTDFLKSALWYAAHGWYVVPLHTPLFDGNGACVGCSCEAYRRSEKCKDTRPGLYDPGYVCPTPGKHPRYGSWEEKATTDPEEIRKMWGWWPNANIGIAAGKSGLLCFDVDSYKDDYTGERLLSRAEENSITNLTGGGGQHLIYRIPEGKQYGNNSKNLPDGIDIRCHGGQFVVPPSIHPSNNQYRWEIDYGPHEIDALPVPEHICAILDECQREAGNVSFSDVFGKKPELAQWRLSGKTVELIYEEPEQGKRSEKDQSVISSLVKAGASDDEIKAVFDHYPIGAKGKYAEKGAYGAQYLAGSIGNARSLIVSSNGTQPPPAQSRTSVVRETGVARILSEIERIASDDDIDKKWQVASETLAEPISHLSSTDIIKVRNALGALDATKTDIKEFLFDCKRAAKERGQERKNKLIERRIEQVESHSDDGQIIIQVNGRDFDGVADDGLLALRMRNAESGAFPIAYVRGGLLTRIATDENNVVTTQPYTDDALRYTLSQCAKWVNSTIADDGTDRTTVVFPPSGVVKATKAMPEYPEFPPLAGITNCPTFGIEGILHDDPGYSASTKLFYANGIDIGDTEPTTENIEKSLDLLLMDLLGDFPFKDDASRAHALALMLLPFVRPMIGGPTPLHLIDAPEAGTGKGLLAEICAIPAMGGDLPSTQAGKDDEEWRKRITTSLMAGTTHISIDNITGPLATGVLASALTQPVWSDRVLGVSREVRIPIRTIWIANGNNVVPSDEIARRIVWIRLDANAERPWEREGFKHENLVAWAKAHRGELVTACITLVRCWINADMLAFTGKRKGSYEKWSEVMGGILQAVCVGDFLANEQELFDTTVNEASALVAFVTEWHERFGEIPVSVKNLFVLASYPDGRAEPGERWMGLLDNMLGDKGERSRRTRLGKLLYQNRDKIISGFKLVQGKMSRGSQMWTIHRVVAVENSGGR